ncbi:hypothetical protein MNV49_002635 [Pseudohyphozyma bogoriensis]|nr:hypothetical protein MNV49_002635 [Pseudohyphozyma bogoriensis]
MSSSTFSTDYKDEDLLSLDSQSSSPTPCSDLSLGATLIANLAQLTSAFEIARLEDPTDTTLKRQQGLLEKFKEELFGGGKEGGSGGSADVGKAEGGCACVRKDEVVEVCLFQLTRQSEARAAGLNELIADLNQRLNEKEETMRILQHDHEETVRRLMQGHEETIRASVSWLSRRCAI